MKKLMFFFLALPLLCFGQNNNQKFNGFTFTYQANSDVHFFEYDLVKGVPTPTMKFLHSKYTFIKYGETVHPTTKEIIYLVRVLPIKKDKEYKESNNGSPTPLSSLTRDSPGGTAIHFISTKDNGKTYWVEKKVLDEWIENGLVSQIYTTGWGAAYGAEIRAPFKARLAIREQNLRIDPGLLLGGYAGFKWKFTKYHPYALNLIASSGLTTVSINEYTLPANGTSEPTPDVQAFAISFNYGIILDMNNFQIGFLHGWDWAGGSVATNWIYKGQQWIALSVGYAFF